MKILNIFFVIFLISFFETPNLKSAELKILYKINNDIITNYDVNYELNYLLTLDKNLKNLPRKELLLTAEKSILREKIKKIEIEKFYDIEYNKAINDEIIIQIINNFRSNLDFEDELSFIDYLKKNNIEYDDLKVKFVIERYWNQLIFDKYNKLIVIDKKKIEKKVEKLIQNKSNIINYDLSEIVYLAKNDVEILKNYEQILNSVKTIGFKETAILYSVSESAKLGGRIGWVNENQISELIKKNIIDLEIGSLSSPITTSGGIIILKLNDKKSETINIDKEKEIEKIFQSEKNKFFNEYSLMYFKEVENKIYVEKF